MKVLGVGPCQRRLPSSEARSSPLRQAPWLTHCWDHSCGTAPDFHRISLLKRLRSYVELNLADDLVGSPGVELGDTAAMEFNVLGTELVGCSTDPLTGWFRDGSCRTGPGDRGSHTICAVMSREFLEHQRSIGNDLTTPMPEYRFPGLQPGDRWCVTAPNWLLAHRAGVAAPVVLEATNANVLGIVPLDVLREHAVDVPPDPGTLIR